MEYVPCPPERRENCQVFEAQGECYEDIHHEYWPRRAYRDRVAKKFVRLAINQTVMCRAIHQDIHAEAPPQKPTRDEMLEAINEQNREIPVSIDAVATAD